MLKGTGAAASGNRHGVMKAQATRGLDTAALARWAETAAGIIEHIDDEDLPLRLFAAIADIVEAGVDIERLGRVEIGSQEFVEVVGSATANQFGRGWLELGAGEEPTEWRRVGTPLVNPIDHGVLSEFRLDELETGTIWVLRVTVEHVNGKTREVRYRFETGQE